MLHKLGSLNRLGGIEDLLRNVSLWGGLSGFAGKSADGAADDGLLRLFRRIAVTKLGLTEATK
jgi:hypothetical protein